jgi:hypothetical protein
VGSSPITRPMLKPWRMLGFLLVKDCFVGKDNGCGGADYLS